MKTTQLFRLLAVMILPVITHAQDLSIEDLVRASKCRNHACYDAYVTAKGFHFYKQLDNGGNQYIYQSNDEFSFKGDKGELLNAHEDSYFLLRSDSSAVSYLATNRKERYALLMDELKDRGFKKSRIENENSDIIIIYASPQFANIELKARTLKANGPKGVWNSYTFTATRKE